MKNTELSTPKRYITLLFSSFLFTSGINLFIVPAGVYNGGTIGIAQIIRTLWITYRGAPFAFDISGIINFFFNIPLFYLAFRISRPFFIRTIFCVITQTIFFSLIPITSIIDDVLTNCIVGGLLVGLGVGITLKSGGSGGGIDVLGVYYALKKPAFSVGKLTLYFNAVIYFICAFLFNLPTAIYSIIYSTIYSMTVDKTHFQNINMNVMIFSKKANLEQLITKQLHRGVTHWKAIGAYTHTNTYVLVTICSKYEIESLKTMILKKDPQAFIIFNEGLQVSGNFKKRL